MIEQSLQIEIFANILEFSGQLLSLIDRSPVEALNQGSCNPKQARAEAAWRSVFEGTKQSEGLLKESRMSTKRTGFLFVQSALSSEPCRNGVGTSVKGCEQVLHSH